MLLNLISHQPDINIKFLYVKLQFKPKYQFLIKKWQEVSQNHFITPINI